MTAASFVAFLNNRKVLFNAIIVFIIPFIIFAFWNFPSADDYMIINVKSKLNFWQLQHSVYYNWTGRYFATFLSSLFSYSGFLYSHYYFHTLLLLLLTVFAWLFCLRQVNYHLFYNRLSFSTRVILAFLLLILEINIIPEPVTAFYWFSSAVTYQVPLIILIFLAGLIIRLLYTSTNKILYFIIASLLIIMLQGCNEIITLFTLINSTILLCYYKATNTKIPFFIILLYLINILSACFLLFSPGILHRSDKISEGSFISAHEYSLN